MAILLLPLALAGCEQLERSRAIEKSMEPTIRSGEVVRVDYDAYVVERPRRGDIVAIGAPPNAESETCPVRAVRRVCPAPEPGVSDFSLFKRVVAVPGDTIAIRPDGRAIVNGRVAREPYIQPCPARDCGYPKPVTIGPRLYFVLGDNRPYSSDSRYWGPVDIDAVEGRVTPPDPSRR